MRSGLRSIARAAFVLFAFPAAGATLTEVDAFAAAPAGRRSLARPADEVSRPGTAVHVEERLGVPTFLQPARAGEKGRRALSRKGVEAVGAARAHLLDLAPLWGLSEEDIARAPLVQVHDTGTGPIVVQLRQEAFGVPVFRDEIRIALDRSYEPVAVAGYLPSVAGLSEPVFTLSAADALAREGILVSPARAKRVLYHLPGRLVPAWYVEFDVPSEPAGSDLYAVVLSAADGAPLYRHRLVESDSFTYRVWAETAGLKAPLNGPQGRGGDPYPGTTPDRWQAPFVAPSLVTLASGPISTGDPWLPAGATETNGNNVDAYADLGAPDGFGTGDFRANVTAPGVFDRTYDVAEAPDAGDDQRKAAIAQLFYVTNFLHDWYYDAGFNEVAGNAQASNYGRGGVEGDALRAEAQDYSGTDNANMSTPSDGGHPRMQMYVWTAQVRRGLAVTAPPAAARNLNIGLAAFGPQAFSLSAPVVAAADGAPPAGDACDPITNGPALTGRIALVDRGTCAFVIKIANVQAAGAAGVIVVNNQGDGLLTMVDSAGLTSLPYTIPSVFLGQSDGAALKTVLAQGLVVTMAREAAVNRDGTIDSQIVAHEWAHYLSNRLVGNANGLRANQSRGLGEGWSDFSALLLTVQAGDAALAGNAGFGGLYPMGGYVLGGGDNGFVDNMWWYFGIRRYPYSTDMTKDPLTYRHITNGVALPAGAPIAYPDDGSANAEVHNTGEVWTTMLWECYAALLRDTGRLAFEQARDRMRAYFVASLKLTPVNPTLLEARDALLAVAFAADRDDHALFVRAFAKRGAGPRAAAGDRFDPNNSGTVESFDVGGDLGIVSVSLDDSAAPCDRDGHLDAGETGTLTLSLKNRGSERLSATQFSVSSSNPAVSFPSGATVSVPSTDPTQATSVSLPVRLATGTTGVQNLGFNLTLRDAGMIADETAAFTARGNDDDVPFASASDDVESTHSAWKPDRDAGLDPTDAFARLEITPFDHRWSTRGASSAFDVRLVSPPLVVGSGAFSFTFRHRYSFFTAGDPVTYYDGGVLETSDDGGATWFDVGSLSISTPYPQRLAGSGNPLWNRVAFAGDSPGWPALSSVTVSLGSAFAGKTVLVRFRRGGLFTTGSNLWEIDDVAFGGITNTPFPSVVADRGRCRGRVIPVGTSGGATVKKR